MSPIERHVAPKIVRGRYRSLTPLHLRGRLLRRLTIAAITASHRMQQRPHAGR